MEQAALQLEEITHIYVDDSKAALVLQDISLSVQPGEFISIIGPSGCGKTTLLSVIAGSFPASAGTVKIFGEEVTSASDRIGYMLQQDFLFPWRTIYSNAIIGLQIKQRLSSATKALANSLLNEMGLSMFRDYLPGQLSGGMRQRAALVRTLVTEPDLLLLDEPFSALDYQTRLQLEGLIWRTLKNKNITVVLVTHDIAEAIAMSDRIFMLQPAPGRLRREIAVPQHIRDLEPLDAREADGFNSLLRSLWQEFDAMEGEGG
jgi:NitT/TauT family transport system ATP-binding protein